MGEPYLSNDVLAEVAGRLRFGGQPLEAKIEQMSLPKPKQWSWPSHSKDRLGAIYGLHGFELNALQDAAMKELPHNEMLQEAYRKFLLIAKIVCVDAVEKVRTYERNQAEQKAIRDRSYQEKLRSYNARKEHLTKSWSDIRDTIRTRWQRMGRSILKMLENNGSLNDMTPRDRFFVEEMAKRGVIAIDRSDGTVINFNWDRYIDFSIEDIDEVIQLMNNDESGNFIKKPTVLPLSEA